MTTKLYDLDAYRTEFTATVLSCEQEKDGYAVVLDETLFFPEEGGQSSDTGTLGNARVTGAAIQDGVITHKTAAPLPVGARVAGKIDWDARFVKMQNHTAEHMFSGICHTLYGCRNVGFHLGNREMTVDFDREITREELDRAEAIVNENVVKNLPVTADYPPPEKLAAMQYRAKLAMTDGVRIVTIPGVDACACCAPHVSSTGQIGLCKVLDAIRYKGGVRVHLLAGKWALEDYSARYRASAAIGAALSVPSLAIEDGVSALQAEIASLRASLAAMQTAAIRAATEQLPPAPFTLCFLSQTDSEYLREYVNLAMEKTGGTVAAFGGKDGEYRYVIGSKTEDLRARAKEINEAVAGRGGGTPEMIRGNAAETADGIRAHFENW